MSIELPAIHKLSITLQTDWPGEPRSRFLPTGLARQKGLRFLICSPVIDSKRAGSASRAEILILFSCNRVKMNWLGETG